MPSSGETSVSAWFGSKKNNNAMVFCLYLFLSHCTDAEQIRSVGSHWGNYYCVKYQSSFSNQAVLRFEPWTNGWEVWTLLLCHSVPLKIISQKWVIPSYLKSSHLKGKKSFFQPLFSDFFISSEAKPDTRISFWSFLPFMVLWRFSGDKCYVASLIEIERAWPFEPELNTSFAMSSLCHAIVF